MDDSRTQPAADVDGLHPLCGKALRHVAAMSAGTPLDVSLRITLNFHPDRLAAGRSVVQALADEGRYLSQFATGTSNGGLSAYRGGDRWRWEHRMFAGAYDEAPGHLRPVYGALNFRRKPVGAAPRFGSAHLRLTASALARVPCRLEWHPGFRLSVTELRRHPDYRGSQYVDLGAAIAVDGRLTPRVIGDAARSGRHDEQDLKRVWHCLARFGANRPGPSGG